MSKRRLGYRLSEPVLVDLRDALFKDGVTKRKKSSWICEGIDDFLDKGADRIVGENYFVGDSLNSNSIGETVVMDEDLSTKLDSMVIQIRSLDPYSDDIQSMLIRAAIKEKIKQVKDRT